jgi:hypothetical protein
LCPIKKEEKIDREDFMEEEHTPMEENTDNFLNHDMSSSLSKFISNKLTR